VRRIDEVARAIERIVKGNLAGRLPTRGTAGDLDRLVEVVNGMLDDIERLMHEVKGVSDAVAHDLRTPLTRLLAGLERAGCRAASVDEYAAAVDEATRPTACSRRLAQCCASPKSRTARGALASRRWILLPSRPM
jgi:methyl-accepting chemotaxis protein